MALLTETKNRNDLFEVISEEMVVSFTAMTGGRNRCKKALDERGLMALDSASGVLRETPTHNPYNHKQ